MIPRQAKDVSHCPGAYTAADRGRAAARRLTVLSGGWVARNARGRLSRYLLLASLVFFFAWFTSADEPGTNSFYFVQITDTHWGARDGLQLTRQLAEAINALPMKIEFVVHTGDILADAIDKEETVKKGLAAMSQIKAPVHYLPGNHDILKKKPKSTAALYKKYFGPLSSQAEYNGVVCLFIYTEPLVAGFRVEGYDPLAWFVEHLKQAGDRPVLVFQHMAAVKDMAKSKYPQWPDNAREDWEAILLSHPQIKAIVAGHFHRDELHWIRDVPVYISAAVARFWDRHPSFRIYEYRDGRLGYWTVFL